MQDVKCETAGNFPSNSLTVGVRVHRCGQIENGVSFDFGEGPWILAYDDLKKIYEAATQARSSDIPRD